jgi:hypothetical protein
MYLYIRKNADGTVTMWNEDTVKDLEFPTIPAAVAYVRKTAEMFGSSPAQLYSMLRELIHAELPKSIPLYNPKMATIPQLKKAFKAWDQAAIAREGDDFEPTAVQYRDELIMRGVKF